MKVLVTGGAGFIGSHIVDRLIEAGFQTVVLDNLSAGCLANVNPAARFMQKDVRDRDLADLLRAEPFDFVIHQAAQTTVPKSLADPRYDCDVNIMGLVNLLEACRSSGVKRIVFASSAAVYGDPAVLPLHEEADKQPTSFYGLSKLTAEKYLELYYKNFGLEYVTLRYANVYGERQTDSGEGGVISIFLTKALVGEPLTVFGDGTQTRDFIYVRDVAEANYRALFTANANRSYNIGTGQEISINELIRLMQRLVGKPLITQYAPPRAGDIYRSALKILAACANLDWQPVYSLAEGLGRTLTSLR